MLREFRWEMFTSSGDMRLRERGGRGLGWDEWEIAISSAGDRLSERGVLISVVCDWENACCCYLCLLIDYTVIMLLFVLVDVIVAIRCILLWSVSYFFACRCRAGDRVRSARIEGGRALVRGLQDGQAGGQPHSHVGSRKGWVPFVDRDLPHSHVTRLASERLIDASTDPRTYRLSFCL